MSNQERNTSIPNQETINISLELGIETIPPAPPCWVCDGTIVEKVQDLEHFARSTSTIVVASGLPGYHCQGCGAEFFHSSTNLEFLKEARRYFTRPEDKEFLGIIDREITSIQESLSKDNPGK